MDDLRTRIAAVLYRLYSHGSWEQLLEIERQAWGDDADAVIRELDSHGWLIDPESGERRRNYPREGNGTSARKDTDE